MFEPKAEPGKNCGGYHVKEYGDRARRAAQNYASYMSGRDVALNDNDESAFLSPPLWKTSPTASPQHRRVNYRCLSPSSKAQAIARGQRELMEMVSKMPESSYELTLKDLVEQQPVDEVGNRQESFRDENRDQKETVRRNDQNYKKVQVKRNGSLNNNNNNNSNDGFLLKMVFPVGFGSKKKKKKNDLGRNNSSKISPKSPVTDGSDKSVDKEWWKKRFSVSSDSSESTGLSSNSGSGKSTVSSSSSSSSRYALELVNFFRILQLSIVLINHKYFFLEIFSRKFRGKFKEFQELKIFSQSFLR